MLNLAPDTGQDDLFAALEKLVAAKERPDSKKFVPIEALQEALHDRNMGHATMSQERALAKVDDAMQRGYISPAMKEWATALCQQDEASFDDFLARTVPPFSHLFQPSGTSASPPEFAKKQTPQIQSDQAQAICDQLGLEPGSLQS